MSQPDSPPAGAGGGVAAVQSLARTPSSGRPASALPAPAIAKPRFNWKTRVALPVALVLAFLLVLGYAGRQTLLPATPVRGVPVVLASTAGARQSPSATVQAPGWAEPDPFAISVPALAAGVIKEVLVLEGQRVEAGQVVARLIDDDAKLALAKAEAELKHWEATHQAAQAQWDNPTERTRAVAAARAAVDEVKASLSMLEAQVAADEAKAKELRYEQDRVQQAFEQKAATPLEAVVATQRLAAAEATLQATQRRRAVLEQQLKQEEAELAAAEQNRRLRIEEAEALARTKADLDLARATRDEAALRLARMEVRSPAAGLVMSRLTTPGSKVSLDMDHPDSAVVVKLYDPAKLQVRVDVPLADAAKVSVGQDAEVNVAVLPDRTFRGKVTRAAHEADVQKNTQQFKVAIVDPSAEIKPEMLTRVKFLAAAPTTGVTAAAATAVFAPQSLLRREGDSDQATAMVVDTKQNVAVRRAVKVGRARKGDWVQIESGLRPGDVLIAEPAGVAEGVRVRLEGEANLPDPADAAAAYPEADPVVKGGDRGTH